MISYGISILKSPRKGIYLSGDTLKKNSFFQQLLYSNNNRPTQYLQEERNLFILSELLKNNSLSYDEIINTMYISVHTLKNDLVIIQSLLQKFDCNLSNKKEHIYIDGNELDIQRCFKNALLNHVEENKNNFKTIMSEVFTVDLYDKIIKFVEEIMMISNKNISDYYFKSLSLSLLIFFKRKLMGKKTSLKEKIFEDLKCYGNYLEILDKLNILVESCDMTLDENELKYINQLIYTHGCNILDYSKENNTNYSDDVDLIVSNISNILNVNLSQDDSLINKLKNHYSPMLNRLSNKIRVRNPLLVDIKKQYMVMFTLTWYVLAFIEKKYSVILTDDEVSFMTIHFQVALDKVYIQKNILIVCPLGLATSELIFNRVSAVLSGKDNIITCNEQQIYTSDLSNIDFIISSIPLPGINKKVINVSNLLTENDVQKIMKYYTSLNGQINTFKKSHKLDNFKFMSNFSKEYVMLNKEYSNKEKLLDDIIDIYYQNNIVKTGFRDSIKDRELKGYTSLMNMVAIPHAHPETVIESKITILTLKKPIKWDANYVRLIMLFAISSEDLNRVRPILSSIFNLLDNKEVVDKILSFKKEINLLDYLEQTVMEDKNVF